MRQFTKRSLVLILALILVCVSVGSAIAARTELGTREESAARIAADAILVRPLSLVATAIGTALFFASLPFSIMGGNVNIAAKKLIGEPAQYTFLRPLGEL